MKRKIGQKAYVLNGGCVGDRYVVGVFSSKKRQKQQGNGSFRMIPITRVIPMNWTLMFLK